MKLYPQPTFDNLATIGYTRSVNPKQSTYMVNTIKRFEGSVKQLRELLAEMQQANPFTLEQTFCTHEDCYDMSCNSCGADFS